MKKRSCGILLYRYKAKTLEVFLVHPGGPFWKNKDDGAWSIPKGEGSPNEEPLHTALREFLEETGISIGGQHAIALTPITQKAGKAVWAWAIPGDADAANITSNEFMMEWPPHSGKQQSFPEVDKAAWFTIAAAKKKINPAQAALLDELITVLKQKL
jgi:predicted NUDIX family NTP pyrophosphohydrolase